MPETAFLAAPKKRGGYLPQPAKADKLPEHTLTCKRIETPNGQTQSTKWFVLKSLKCPIRPQSWCSFEVSPKTIDVFLENTKSFGVLNTLTRSL